MLATYSSERCLEMGLKITKLESDQALQEAVLSLHHACMLTFSQAPASKIIENHKGIAFIKLMPGPSAASPEVANKPMELLEA